MVLASIIETIGLAYSGTYQAALLNSTAPFVFSGGLLLMRAGHTLIARVFVLTIAYAAGYCLATMLGPHSQIQQLLLFASILSFTFFTLDQWKHIAYGLSLPLVSYALLELTDYRPPPGFDRIVLSEKQNSLIRFTTVAAIWIQIVGQTVYLIRSRKRTQERLISSAKMVAMGQMAAGIAHEVNNPLHLIVAHAEKLENLAAKGEIPRDQGASIATQIQKISIRIGNIIHGLQALSRDASGDPYTELPLRQLLDSTLDYCRKRIEARKVQLTVAEIPESWIVVGREAQLSEVLLNLLNNALDAAEKLEERWINVEARAVQGAIEILVTDSGHGIPKPIRTRIFDPFFTTKPVGKGTGLGLSVSHGIMTAHQGLLYYDESSPRTRFVMRVPRAPQGSART